MNRQRAPPRPHPRVPKTPAVQPGAAVHIVLKADQPTGRTVSGTVRDVLTRGNHPRGIKVRLADGRVGRVQRMAGAAAPCAAAGGGATPATAPPPSAEMATCPVCAAFEGDEPAVAHHVAGHFDAPP